MSPASHPQQPAVPIVDGGLLCRYRLDIAYDGAAFSGWARQPGRRTVQGVLEEALSTLLRAPAALTVAGRTDAGVHATGQVAHVDVPADGPDAGQLGHRLARLLPADVRVPAVAAARPGFDARFSALRRHYRYRVCDAPWGVDPLRRHDTLAWHRPLDVAMMNAASTRLLGEHDFAAFCRRREGASTIRELQRLDWARPEPHLVVAHVTADAFCHSMVRSLVGALLAVGEGRRPAGWPVSLLSARERASDVHVVAPHGLVLIGVDYPPDDELAAQAQRTRAVRSAPWVRISHRAAPDRGSPALPAW